MPSTVPAVEQLAVVITSAAFDASLAFYRDVIGLEVVEEWIDAGHGAILSAGGPARVELIDLPERALRVETESLFIGLQVPTIEDLYDRAKAAGHEMFASPRIGPGEDGASSFAIRTAWQSTSTPLRILSA